MIGLVRWMAIKISPTCIPTKVYGTESLQTPDRELKGPKKVMKTFSLLFLSFNFFIKRGRSSFQSCSKWDFRCRRARGKFFPSFILFLGEIYYSFSANEEEKKINFEWDRKKSFSVCVKNFFSIIFFKIWRQIFLVKMRLNLNSFN